jgi:hypothetical protein
MFRINHRTLRSRSALEMTLTDDSAIARRGDDRREQNTRDG